MIKVIVSDLDGTLLLNGAQSLKEETLSLIKCLLDNDIIFVAASGRQYPNMCNLFAPIKNEISYICENGALIIHKGKIISKKVIDRETGLEILDAIIQRDGCEVLLSGENTSYIQPKNHEFAHHMQYVVKNNVTIVEDIMAVQEPYMKISIYEKDGINNSENYWKERFHGKAAVVTSGNLWLDTIPLGVNKGSALHKLLNELNISPEYVMAFGDHNNDIEMLKQVKYSYAMENAQESVKKISSSYTDSVEKILQEVLNSKWSDTL